MIDRLGRLVGAVLGTILHFSLLPSLGVLYVVVRILRFRALTRHGSGDGAEDEVMIGLKVTLAVGAMILAAAGMPGAQDRAPGSGDPAAIRTGQGLFRERCAECHGADAKGVAGHDLTRLWTSGATDERVFQTIRTGVPNTHHALQLRARRRAVGARQLLAQPERRGVRRAVARQHRERRADFLGVVRSCHAVDVPRRPRSGPTCRGSAEPVARGAHAGDSRARTRRSPAGYQPVTLVTRDGQRIRGTRKSEDAFSIQIMDTREQLQGYLKASLREVIRDTDLADAGVRAGSAERRATSTICWRS